MHKIQTVPLESIIPLRHKVLRSGRPIEESTYQEDTQLECFHLACFDQAKVIGIASFYLEAHDSVPCNNAWRLRGMAVDPEYQGRGIGTEVLKHGISLCVERDADVIWCNARTKAVSFYLKLNFVIKGEEFQLPGIGPHYFMSKTLAQRE